jgi:hypothetical protein
MDGIGLNLFLLILASLQSFSTLHNLGGMLT